MSCSCSSGLGASGPLCATGDCAAGRVSVQEMRSTFDALVANPQFDRWRFESSVVALESTYNATAGWFSEWIPFNPNCCAIKDIGIQADELTRQMLVSVGSADAGQRPASQAGFDLNSLMTVGALLLGVMLLSNVKGLVKS
jgi:hypothetical protein